MNSARSTLVFFFQAEDGIRITSVTGVQTCALPILGNTFCFIYDNKEIEIKKINGIWTLIQ